MEKNFRLSSREEKILGYSTFAADCIDGLTLLLLSTAMIGYVTSVERNRHTLRNALNFALEFNGAATANTVYAKVATLGVTLLLVTRTLLYFLKRYFEWKAVVNNISTEEDN